MKSFISGVIAAYIGLRILANRPVNHGRTDLDLDLEELAAIAQHKGWATGNQTLTANEIATQYEYLAAALDADEHDQAYTQTSRFALIKHPDFESTYTACLVVGFVHREVV